MIRCTNQRVTNGRNVWHFSGTILAGQVQVTEILGDVTDMAGFKEALHRKMQSKPRYRRVMGL